MNIFRCMSRMLTEVTALFFLTLCSRNPVTVDGGGGMETTNGVIIAGKLYTGAQTAAVNSEVILNRYAQETGRLAATLPSCTTRTDKAGEYRFISVQPGSYIVSCVSSDLREAAVTPPVIISEAADTVIRLSDSLVKATSANGIVNADDTVFSYTFWLKDTPYGTTASPESDVITFPSVPEGRHVLFSLITNPVEKISGLIGIDTIFCSPESIFTVENLAPPPLVAPGGSLLFDDFEDGDYLNTFGQTWWIFNEAGTVDSASASAVSRDSVPVSPGAEASGFCFGMSYTFREGGEYVGCGGWFSSTGTIYRRCFDMSQLTGVSFRLRGSADRCTIGFNTGTSSGPIPITDIDTMKNEWSYYEIDRASISAQDTGSSTPWTDHLRYATGFVVIVTDSDDTREGYMMIDDIRFEF